MLPGRRGEPIDVWQAEGLVALPVAVRLRRSRGGARGLRRPRPGDPERPVRAPAGTLARHAAAPGARLGAEHGRGGDGQHALRGCAGRGWGRQPADHLERAIGLRSRPIRLVGCGTSAWASQPGTPVVLYLGLVLDGRGIAQLCEAIGLVPEAVLVVAGYGADYERFQARGRRDCPTRGRIHFTGPVAPADILDSIAAADVSAMPVEGDTLNHQLNTPTKLFDAMGAGVPVVASDLPGMAPIVRETGCGELCDPTDPADIARAIRAIVDAPPERRAAYREACLTAARDVYAWEHQAPVLLDMYRPSPRRP